MEDRRFGDGDEAPPPYRKDSELRFCQNIRGEVMDSTGEDWNGEESGFCKDFLGEPV